jgi:hypothetical protein
MKQFFKPYNLLMYLLALLSFFFVGVSYAGITEAGKNQGLAGGAIVLGYGVIAAGIAFVISLFIASGTGRKRIIRINQILTIVLLGFIAYFSWSYQKRAKAKSSEPKSELPVKSRPSTTVAPEAQDLQQESSPAIEEKNNSEHKTKKD